MAAAEYTIRFAVHQLNKTTVVLRDATGREVGRFDLPDGYEMRTVPAPWWRRLAAWARLRFWRARVAWGG